MNYCGEIMLSSIKMAPEYVRGYFNLVDTISSQKCLSNSWEFTHLLAKVCYKICGGQGAIAEDKIQKFMKGFHVEHRFPIKSCIIKFQDEEKQYCWWDVDLIYCTQRRTSNSFLLLYFVTHRTRPMCGETINLS